MPGQGRAEAESAAKTRADAGVVAGVGKLVSEGQVYTIALRIGCLCR